MDREELKQKYKILPLWARFALVGVVGLLPGLYKYFDEAEQLEADLVEVQGREVKARDAFELARQRKASLPKLEEQLAYTEDQLTKAKRMLPDQYIIEEILEKTATIAKSTGVTLTRFKPLPEVPHRGEQHSYVELPIETEIEGDFRRTANFFDKIAHLESSIFIRKIDMSLASAQKDASKVKRPTSSLSSSAQAASSVTQEAETPLTPYEAAKKARDQVKQKTKFNLIVYRGMGENEVFSGDNDVTGAPQPGPNASGRPSKAPEQPPPAGAAPPPPAHP